MKNISNKFLFIVYITTSLVLTSCGGDNTKKEEVKNKPPVNVIGILKSGDPSKCDVLEDETKIKNCVNNMHYDQAVTKRNPDLCDEMDNKDSANKCKLHVYFDKALTENNKEACKKIENKDLQKDCQNNILVNDALQKKDVTMCKEYQGDTKFCEDHINLSIARDSKDKKLCDKLQDKVKKEQCISELTTIPLNPTPLTGGTTPPKTN